MPPESRSPGQGEIKGCPFIYFGFRPDASAVALDDTLHNGQADTRALEFVSAMESLKDTEEFSSISRIECE